MRHLLIFVLILKKAIPYPENEGVGREHENEDGGEAELADFRPNGNFNISPGEYEISDPTSSACRYGPPASLQPFPDSAHPLEKVLTPYPTPTKRMKSVSPPLRNYLRFVMR